MMTLSGTVVHGKGEARGTGYPTANLAYEQATHPEKGVWTCRVAINNETHQGLAVVGMWEMPHGGPSVEVYVLDLEQDLYNEHLTVTPLNKLRELLPFKTTDALVTQIKQDLADARDAFNTS